MKALTRDERHERILDARGHVLVTGGPGSGKTTVSILKAANLSKQVLQPGQRILFLSFARATVQRVIEAMTREHELSSEIRTLVQVETYHAFFWRLLKTHGYLIGLPRTLKILLPQAEAIALSGLRSEYESDHKLDDESRADKARREQEERQRLAYEESRVCFSLFADLVGTVLHGSSKIRDLVGLMYPHVFVDEFQDTNDEQWNALKAICTTSSVCALADPEQRIYDWIGADPARLDHFREHCAPTEVDLGGDNHRSAATEIRQFGDDILRGKFRRSQYHGVTVQTFEANQNQAATKVVTATLQSRARLIGNHGNAWSLVVLTPTKRLTRFVSDVFRDPPSELPAIQHSAAVEMEGAILGAEFVGLLLQQGENGSTHFQSVVFKICDFYRGKGGDSPSRNSIQEADRIMKAYEDFVARQRQGKTIRGNSLLVAMCKSYEETRRIKMTGIPDHDWKAVSHVLRESPCRRLREVSEELKNVRMLDRGMQLRQLLSENWRRNGTYVDAHSIVQQTFVQQHFAMSRRPETGVVVMNMHKAKGKQFDEVILFEGWPRYAQNEVVSNPDRFVRGNARSDINDQALQNIRVSITRAKENVIVLTPRQDPSVLLVSG